VSAGHDIDPTQPIHPKESDMATTASKRTSDKASVPKGGSPPSNGRDSDAVRDLFVHATRVQLATLTSVSKLVVGWAQSADRYAQAISDELLYRARGEIAPGELVGRLAVVSSRHLRELTGLPTDAVNHFNSEVANGTQRRRRSPRESVSGPTSRR
jgi:hypothetical protein